MLGPLASLVTASSALVKTGPGAVHGAILTAGSDAATLILYDNTSGTGTKVIGTIKAAINTTVGFSIPNGAAFSKGLYATIIGTSPEVTVVYS